MSAKERTKAKDIVKAELHLNNDDYEAIYTDIAYKMRDSGLFGGQIRSIEAKAATKKMGVGIRRKYKHMFNGVSDATLNANVLRIAQRVNNNRRRIEQRKQERLRRQKACYVGASADTLEDPHGSARTEVGSGLSKGDAVGDTRGDYVLGDKAAHAT